MHIPDKQLGIQTRNLDPVDYDFTLLENRILFPINIMEKNGGTLVCSCAIVGNALVQSVPAEKPKYTVLYFCKCQKVAGCKNPFS